MSIPNFTAAAALGPASKPYPTPLWVGAPDAAAPAMDITDTELDSGDAEPDDAEVEDSGDTDIEAESDDEAAEEAVTQ
jgi:hypothetical protein